MVNIKISRFPRAKKTEPVIQKEINEPIVQNEIIEPIKEINEPIKQIEPIIQNEINEPLTFDNIENDDFLNDLNSLNYKPDETIKDKKIKEVKTKDKPFDLSNIIDKHKEKITQPSTFSLDSNDLLEKIKNKSIKNKNEKTSNDYDDSIFSQTGSEILGRDKRILLTKIRQYKTLFPDTFKNI